jgi:hypothetical protein
MPCSVIKPPRWLSWPRPNWRDQTRCAEGDDLDRTIEGLHDRVRARLPGLEPLREPIPAQPPTLF